MSSASIPAGSNGAVSVVFFSRGNDNTLSFSLNFDIARLAFASASAGTSLPAGASVIFNTSQVIAGRLGVTVTLPAGQSFVTGPYQLISLNLTALGNAPLGTTSITFGDIPVSRTVVQPNGSSVPLNQVTFNSGLVTITAPLTPRNVRVIGTSIQAGTNGSVEIEIDAQGNENGLAFSLTFETTKLSYVSASLGSGVPGASLNINTTSLGTGQLGLRFDLPAGQPLQAGTNSVVSVVLAAGASAPLGTTGIAFNDSPTARDLVDINDMTLPASYTDGTVTIEGAGFESDTAPRPNGDGTVSLADWVQTGRIAVGLDPISPGSEYQRADCAPRETKGNGQLSLSDWVQAGRYGSRLDPVVSAGGPTAPVPFAEAMTMSTGRGVATSRFIPVEPRAVKIVTNVAHRMNLAQVEIVLDATGIENAISLVLAFDSSQWDLVEARPGIGFPDATLIFKSASDGTLTLALALPPGSFVNAGSHTLIDVTFRRRKNSFQRIPILRFATDAPVKAEIVDTEGNSLTGRWSVPGQPGRVR